MSIGSRLFDWVQSAPFYVETHREAVALLPEGSGRRWLDVGCGPGLVARLAEERGYEAIGLDRDPEMVRAARRHATQARFEIGDLSEAEDADVVSAASLLFVLPDAAEGLRALWRSVRPGGALLVVETTARMTPAGARALARRRPELRHPALWLWARVRGGRHVDPTILDGLDANAVHRRDLLDGLVEAWLLWREGP